MNMLPRACIEQVIMPYLRMTLLYCLRKMAFIVENNPSSFIVTHSCGVVDLCTYRVIQIKVVPLKLLTIFSL